MSHAALRMRQAAAGRSRNASGIPMPGTLAGWTRVMAEDFDSPFAVGGVSTAGVFPAPYTDTVWAYADGTMDTAGSQGQPSRYHPSTVLSVSGSALKKSLYVAAGPQPRSAAVGVVPSTGLNRLYGRFVVCVKITSAAEGWKLAWLTWPSSENWPTDGELDYPEGSIAGPYEGIAFNFHKQGGDGNGPGNVDHFDAGVLWSSAGMGNGWHVLDMAWAPGAVRTWLNGNVVGTSYAKIPNTTMRYMMQTETDVGVAVPTLPAELLCDWVAVYDWVDWAPAAVVKADTLVESFTTLDRATKWQGVGITHSAGQVSISHGAAGAYNTNLASVERYDLTSSSIYAAWTPDLANTSSISWWQLTDTSIPFAEPRNQLVFYKYEGGPYLIFRSVTNGVADDSVYITDYSTTTHALMRFRCDATNVYWETSPAGTPSWTVRRTLARATLGWTPSAMQASFGCGWYGGTGGTPNPMVVTGVNAA